MLKKQMFTNNWKFIAVLLISVPAIVMGGFNMVAVHSAQMAAKNATTRSDNIERKVDSISKNMINDNYSRSDATKDFSAVNKRLDDILGDIKSMKIKELQDTQR